MLSGRGIYKQFRGSEHPILDDIDIEVQPGTVTALIGSNGCGKSTLLRALALIEQTDQGIVTIDGTEYSPAADGRPEPSPWPTVTMVFQQLFLWPHLTVRNNIMLPQPEANGEAMRRFEEVVTMFDLAGFVDRFPDQISVGQRQRVALARAVALRPRYLFLDEVTSALDVGHVATLRSSLADLRGRGIGVLLVSHMIGFARAVSDRVLFMADGRIAEEGGPDVLSSPRTQALTRFLAIVESAATFERTR